MYPYKNYVFVDVDENPREERQFLKRLDLIAQRVKAVGFHALRSGLQQRAAARM